MFQFILTLLLPVALCNKSVEYLTRYGYLNENAQSEDIEEGVLRFQEVFGLTPTGILDNETVELLSAPRCGNEDSVQTFSAKPNRKWHLNTITWYQYGSQQHANIIEKAFTVWGKHTNVTFKRDFKNPTIIISFSDDRKHLCYSRHDYCYYEFDGQGSILGHAYLPTTNYNQTDIHLDSEENWDFSMNIPQSGNVSFFLVVLHEIGHALGLDHSYDNRSIMFPLSRDPVGISDLNEYELSNDDILAIQFLYGRPNMTTSTTTSTSTTTTTTTTTSTTTTTTTKPEAIEDRNICEIGNQIKTFLIVNKKIFAFFREYVWVMNLEVDYRFAEEYTRPKKITDWLGFLPRDFNEVSAIYQRPDGDVCLFTNRNVYIIRYPSLTLKGSYSINSILGRSVSKINTVISTNSGQTYLIADDSYLFRIDECTFRGTFLGSVSSTLYGIPSRITGAFKYINGRIYFLTDSSVLEYNEFTNTVTGSQPNALDILQITCMREILLNKLYRVLKYFQ